MGDIIEFKNIKKKNVDVTELNLLFSNLENNIVMFIEENKDIIDIDQNFYDLFNEFKKIKNKLNNISFLTDKKVEEFISMFNDLDKMDDIYSKYSLLLEYVYIFYITKGDILEEDKEFVNVLLISFCEMDKIGIKSYSSFIKNISYPIVKEVINKQPDERGKKIVMENILKKLNEGNSVLDAVMTNNNETEINDDVNDLPILNIDNIQSYYYNQAVFFGIDILPEHVFDNIGFINFINRYNGIIKDKFIQLIIFIRNLEQDVLKELELVSDLVDIFDYFSDRIIEYDNRFLENLLLFKNMNKIDAEEAFKYYTKNSESNDGGLKL